MDCKYKVINEALADIYALRAGRKFTNVSSETSGGDYENRDTTEIYSLGVDDLHIKLVLRADSYGNNEGVISVQIVKPIVKQVTDFETI